MPMTFFLFETDKYSVAFIDRGSLVFMIFLISCRGYDKQKHIILSEFVL
jgi:hypothetical protein